ncbi:hypothetical protein PO909_016966 [Leuciscus waleckii]
MKPNTSVVRPKLISLPTESRLIIKDITDARPSCSSNYTSSPPVSGCYTSVESRMNVFSAREKCPCCPSSDGVLITHNPTSPLSQEFHVYHSHNLTRFAHRKELSPRDPRPHIYRSDYLTSFPSVLLPATTPSVSGRLCLSQNYKNRPRVTNRVRNLFPVGANNKTCGPVIVFQASRTLIHTWVPQHLLFRGSLRFLVWKQKQSGRRK